MNRIDDEYRVPDPMSSFEEWQRSEHRDLPDFDLFDLIREEELVKYALVRTPRREESRFNWLLERLAAVRHALRLLRETGR